MRAVFALGAPGSDRAVPVAIVTGADSGIGRATAVALAAAGCDVGITFHSDAGGAQETAREVRDRHGRRSEVRRVDTSRVAEAVAAAEELIDALGGVDVWVNNAGTGTQTPVLELDEETFRHVVDTDLTGAFFLAQAAAKRMVRQRRGGRIVNVTSVHEHAPLQGATPYVAAKHGLGGVTKNMALELAEHGITVNSVAPGEIATPMTGQEDVDPHDQERPGVPLDRPGDAREIAAAIVYLASAQASYTTGTSLVVDGGMLLMGPAANQLAG